MRMGMKDTGKARTWEYIYMNTWDRENVGSRWEASLLVRGPSIGPVPVHEVGGESHVGPKRDILTVTAFLSLRPWVIPGG
jgi:hypothetical protein